MSRDNDYLQTIKLMNFMGNEKEFRKWSSSY